jgi:hypothetical protein
MTDTPKPGAEGAPVGDPPSTIPTDTAATKEAFAVLRRAGRRSHVVAAIPSQILDDGRTLRVAGGASPSVGAPSLAYRDGCRCPGCLITARAAPPGTTPPSGLESCSCGEVAMAPGEAEQRWGSGCVHRRAAPPGTTPAPACTGLSARWCPVHGDCTCPPDDSEDLAAHGCPLHSAGSDHAEVVAPPGTTDPEDPTDEALLRKAHAPGDPFLAVLNQSYSFMKRNGNGPGWCGAEHLVREAFLLGVRALRRERSRR